MKISTACQHGSALLMGLSTCASAFPNPFALLSRQTKDSACTNGPNTRSCWQAGFSIVTDFDAKAPPAGRERHYNLEVTNITLAPDGVERLVLAVNNQYCELALAFDLEWLLTGHSRADVIRRLG